MLQRLTSSPDFIIRPLETPAEVEAYVRMNAETFRSDEDPLLVASRRRRLIVDDPDFRAISLHGAFLGRKHVGSYRIQERTLCLGPARLRTGCIGGVVTHPDYRHQGIATAMMQDALAFAHDQHYDLLLLHGIPGFYQQLGFVDVLEDMPQYVIARALIPQQTPQAYTVRPAARYDARALLALYQLHYSTYSGSFAPTRTVERQEHYLQNWFQENIPLLALNAGNEPEGYLLLSRRRMRLYAYEAAANTWPAALALLQHHSQLLAAETEPPAELSWPLPPTDATSYLLTDHLPLHSEMDVYPNGGWMARPVSLPALFQALLPLWQERWLQQRVTWIGILGIIVGEHTNFLEIQPRGLQLVENPTTLTQNASFSQQVFTQLVFGFRPITWAAGQPGQYIPGELVPVLNVLFPLCSAWIAGSDGF